MTEPFTPENCDLRDFPRMMLDIQRLRNSPFDAIADDAAWRAGLNLWMSAWHAIPAASLESEEAALCKAAGLGRDLRTWKRIRAAAMRGWVLCNDGRLYHETVAEIALEAWLEKLAQRLSSGAGNAKRWGTVFDPAPVEAEIGKAIALLAALNPDAKAIPKASRRLSRPRPGGTSSASQRDAQIVPSGSQEKLNGIDNPLTPKGEPQLSLIPAEAEPDEVRLAFNLWNETAKRCGLPNALTLDDGRRRAIRKRLDVAGLAGWREALAAVEASALCVGQKPGRDGGSPFRADLGFVCQAKSFGRLREGFYGNDAKPIRSSATVEVDPLEQTRRRVDRYLNGSKFWNATDWGPPPGKPGCEVPPQILAEFGLGPTGVGSILPFPPSPSRSAA